MLKEIFIGLVILLITGYLALQFRSFKDWLLYGVSEAEKYLGSGTGALKLRFVYDLTITKYPLLAKLMPFHIFSSLVDTALDQLKELIKNNIHIAQYLRGDLNDTL